MKQKTARRILIFTLFFLRQALVPEALGQTADEGIPTSADGELTVIHADDFVNQRSENFYLLEDKATKKTYKIRFKKLPDKPLKTGQRIRLKGLAKNSELVVPANGEEISVVEAASAPVSGEQRTIVIAVNFLDAPLECSVSSIQDAMFGNDPSVDGLFQEMSSGNVWITGTTVGPFTINYLSSGACDYNGWAAAAEAAAQAQGVDLSFYNRRVIVFPKNNPCGWAGLGTVGGNPSRAWIASCNLPDVYAHELGHNLTLHHASTDANNDGVSDCEYCDRSDIMGYGGVGFRQLNAPHREQMGWLPAGKVVTATANTTVTIAPLEWDSQYTPYPQVLKIAKPGTSDFYYFSYRQRVGYDSSLSTSYSDKLNVHRYRGSGATQTYFITALSDGGTFQDPATGFSVTQLYHNNSYVQVQVAFNCSVTAPAAAVQPATQSGAPGATVSYNLALTNNDSGPCSPTTFYLTPSLPAGWNVTVSPTSLTLASGQTGYAQVTVTSPPSSPNGSNTITVNISDSFNAGHATSASVTYNVDSSVTTGPSNLKAKSKRGRVRLAWKPPKDRSRLSGYAIWRNGVKIAESLKPRYKENVYSDGTYEYTVTAVDVVGNASPPSNPAMVTVADQAARTPGS